MSNQDFDEERPWRWRNLRHAEIMVSIVPFPWDWHVQFCRSNDDDAGGCYGVSWNAQIGPFCFGLHVTHGNCSAKGWRGRFGLSEDEAWERSSR